MKFLVILPLLLSVSFGFNLFSNNIEDVIKSAIVYDCATAGSGAKVPVLNDCSRFVFCDGTSNITLTCRLSEPHFDRCTMLCVNDMTVCNQASCDSQTTATTTTVTTTAGEVTTTTTTTVTTTVSDTTTRYIPPTVPVSTTAGAETTTTAATPKTCTIDDNCLLDDCTPNTECDELCVCDLTGSEGFCKADETAGAECPPVVPETIFMNN